MDWRRQVYLQHQQQRWLRPDAARWVRPDAAKFLKPGTKRAISIRRSIANTTTRVHIYRSNSESEEVGDGGSNFSLPSLSFDIGEIASEIDKIDLFDIKPRERQPGGIQLAGDLPDGFETPDDEPPKVPKTKPKKSSQRTALSRAITSFARRYPTIAGDIVVAIIKNIEWLEDIEAMLRADLDPPKTMQDLQAGVGQRRPGYDDHHITEQTGAERWGLTRSEIDDPSNLVSIPRLRHYQITGWYGTKNDDYGGLSPRDYLADKTPEERRSIGLYALVKFKVLKP